MKTTTATDPTDWLLMNGPSGSSATMATQVSKDCYRGNQTCTWQLKNNGSSNSVHKVLLEDGTAWAVRFPIPGRVMHPYEKICREVAIMKFVKENTSIPVPAIIAFGTATENHDSAIGPFLITEEVEGKPVTAFLEKLPRPNSGPVLRDDIEEYQLRTIYSEMASILVELAKHDFDKVGALSADRSAETSSWSVKSRPMILRVNDIEAGGDVVADSKAFCRHVLILFCSRSQIAICLPSRPPQNTCKTLFNRA